jgi:hypothetical protein
MCRCHVHPKNDFKPFPSATEKSRFGHRIASDQRHHLMQAAVNGFTTRSAIMLALGDRRLDRAMIDDRHFEACPTGRARQNRSRRFCARRPAARAGAQLHSRFPPSRPCGNSGFAFHALKPHSMNFTDSCDAPVEAVQPGHHHHQPAAILFGRAGKAIARFFGVAGLEAVGPGDLAEQRIAIGLT